MELDKGVAGRSKRVGGCCDTDYGNWLED